MNKTNKVNMAYFLIFICLYVNFKLSVSLQMKVYYTRHDLLQSKWSI